MLRDWAFDESSLSSATTSGLLMGLREKWNKPPQEHTSPSGHQFIFIKLLPPRMEEQHADTDKRLSSQRTSRRVRLQPAMGKRGSSWLVYLLLPLLGPKGLPAL